MCVWGGGGAVLFLLAEVGRSSTTFPLLHLVRRHEAAHGQVTGYGFHLRKHRPSGLLTALEVGAVHSGQT